MGGKELTGLTLETRAGAPWKRCGEKARAGWGGTGGGQEVGIGAAGRVPPPVCLAATGTGVTDGPVDAEPALPSACRTPVPAGWAAGAVPLVSAAARDSRGGCCLRVLLQSRAARACVMLHPSSAPSRSWR